MKCEVKFIVEFKGPDGVCAWWKELPEPIELPEDPHVRGEWLSQMERKVHDAIWTVLNPRPPMSLWEKVLFAWNRGDTR